VLALPLKLVTVTPYRKMNPISIQGFMEVKIYKTILEISETAWNALVPAEFPFAQVSFLRALERNDCLGARTGWNPHFITAWRGDSLLGSLILYQKTNSYGEFIFDFAWAEAHQSHGFDYYPKFVAAIPFTPVTGRKLLLHKSATGPEAGEIAKALLTAAAELVQRKHGSSLHALFISPEEISRFQEAGFFIRHSFQFHWKNAGYKTFEDFLTALRSKRRREVLRERSQVAASGVRIQRLTGADLRPEHAVWMHQFYLSTVQKMGGFDYLTRGFFQEVFSSMKEQVLFVLATDAQGHPVAGALNFFAPGALFGRHWGCVDEYKALHFEVCYYQGIEFAIEHGCALFEAGAQGEHKHQRGFLPSLTYSAHRIQEPRLGIAIEDFVEREKIQLHHLFEEYEEHNPFQRG
jgi:hypothetical protein